MSFNNSFTAVTGATYTAAQYNTHTRDNLTAIWVYTTAGDIAYATGATSLARLGIGANTTTVLMPASGVPSWSHSPQIKGVLHAEANVYFSNLGQSSSSSSYVDVTNATVNIVTTQICTICMFAQGQIAQGTGGFTVLVRGSIGGVGDSQNDETMPQTSNPYYVPFAYLYKRTGVAAGTITCKMQMKTGGAGIGYFYGGRILAEAFVE